MGKYLLAFFFSCSSLLCAAQLNHYMEEGDAFIASNEEELKKAVTDSAKGYLSFKLSVYCRLQNDTVKAAQYFNQAIALSANNPFLHAISFYYKAHNLYIKRDMPGAIACLLKGDSLLDKFNHKEAFTVKALIWHTYGTFQQIMGDEKVAMDAFVNKALPYSQKSDDFYIIANVQKSVGIVFMNALQRDKAAIYFAAAKNSMGQSQSKSPARWKGLVEICIAAAENYSRLKQHDSAKACLDLATSVLKNYPQSHFFLPYYFAEGVYHSSLGNFAEAIKSYDKGIGLGIGNGPFVQYPVNRLKAGKYEALFKSGNYAAAITTINDLLKSPLVFEQDKRFCYEYLYNSYAKLGNTKEAFKWSEKYITLIDSLHKKEIEKEITSLETKYQNAEKEKKIFALEAEKEKDRLAGKNNRIIIGLLIVALVFFVALSVLALQLHRNSRKLSKQRELGYKQQLTEVKQQQQLQLAQALLKGEERERKRLAGDLHDGLGGMLAGVKINLSKLPLNGGGDDLTSGLLKSIKQLDGSINELRRIARNLMPDTLMSLGLEPALKDMCESLLSEKTKISFQAFNIRNDLRQDIQLAIYRIVQELLANAVRHANANHILVQCSQNEAKFFITIEDDGQGFDATKTNGHGIGLTNVRSRAQYFKGDVEIETGPGQGTIINIELDVDD